MNTKKNPEANLERLRFPLFLIGLTFAASFVLTAFEWRSFEKTNTIISDDFGPLPFPNEIVPPVPVSPKLKPPSNLAPAIDGKSILGDILVNDALPSANLNEGDQFEIFTIDMPGEVVFEEEVKLEDEHASFPGGLDSLTQYFSENLRYPTQARTNGVKGTVYVEFIVSENGDVMNPKLLRGIGFGCDAEAINLIEKMPKWNPARQNGKRVPVTFRLPVKFTLQ